MANSPTIGFRLGLLAVKGAAIDAEEHSHNAIQLIWPVPQHSYLFNQTELTAPLLVAANQAHSLTMELGWVVLIEPQSQLGEAISASLTAQSTKLLVARGDFPETFAALMVSLESVFEVSSVTESSFKNRVRNFGMFQ